MAIELNSLTPVVLGACILYDPSDGRIAHVHRIVAYGNATPNNPDVEARCLKIAEKLGHETLKLKVLRIADADLRPTLPYKVDIHSLKLIELARSKR